MGNNALGANTTGSYNVAIGKDSLGSNTTASNSTAIGYTAGYSATGAGNTFVGYGAGYGVTTGAGNTFVGPATASGQAGFLVTTGSKNTILGGYTGNQGGLDIRTASNYIVLSDGDGAPRAYSNGSKWVMTGPLSAGGTSATDQKTSIGSFIMAGSANTTYTFTFASNGGSSQYHVSLSMSAYASAGSGSFTISAVDGGHNGGAIYHQAVETARGVSGFTIGTLTKTTDGFTYSITFPGAGGTVYGQYMYMDNSNLLPTITMT
jgi:hypothetical protein